MAECDRKSVVEDYWVHIKNNIKIITTVSIRVIHQPSIQEIYPLRHIIKHGKKVVIKTFIQDIKVVWIYINDSQAAKYSHWYQWQETFVSYWLVCLLAKENVLYTQSMWEV